MISFLSQARDLFPYTRDIRRDFHRFPELGFQEHRTTEKIIQELSKLEELTIQTGIAKTGVVSILEGEKKAK